MAFGICSIASSSAGNCYLIKSDSAAIILDCGVSTKRIKENLFVKGVRLEEIDAILVTHCHSDHTSSLKVLSGKAKNADVYMTRGTEDAIHSSDSLATLSTALLLLKSAGRLRTVRAGESFTVGDIRVMPFSVSHDVSEPVAYAFYLEDDGVTQQISVVTDTGVVTDEIFEIVKTSDLLIIESNHEPEILLYGSYPYPLKQRILSDVGHLSNEACGECLAKILKFRETENGGFNAADTTVPAGENPPLRVCLAHLSQENNTPEQALLTVRNLLEETGFYVGNQLTLETLKRDEASRFMCV